MHGRRGSDQRSDESSAVKRVALVVPPLEASPDDIYTRVRDAIGHKNIAQVCAHSVSSFTAHKEQECRAAPGTYFGDLAAARRLTREVNEDGAAISRAHPGRFGHFASLPLPDVEPSPAEVLPLDAPADIEATRAALRAIFDG